VYASIIAPRFALVPYGPGESALVALGDDAVEAVDAGARVSAPEPPHAAATAIADAKAIAGNILFSAITKRTVP
jgi:hypothetical protein